MVGDGRRLAGDRHVIYVTYQFVPASLDDQLFGGCHMGALWLDNGWMEWLNIQGKLVLSDFAEFKTSICRLHSSGAFSC